MMGILYMLHTPLPRLGVRIANPDLPEHIRTEAKLNPLDPTTIYFGNARGLLDYPTQDVPNSPSARQEVRQG
jgi:hypothetical protein